MSEHSWEKHMKPVEHPFIALIRTEPEMRRKRFLKTLLFGVALLTADEMDKIEPIIQQAIGRVTIAKMALE